MKKNLLITIIILMLLPFLFFAFVSIYNHCLHPFESYNKDVLYNYTEYGFKEESYGWIFKNYYKDFVNVEYYDENYTTDFFCRKGSDALLPGLSSIYHYYSNSSFSYIIYLDDNYIAVKEDIIKNLCFLETPTGKDSSSFQKDITINGYIFNEIWWQSDYFVEIFDSPEHIEHLIQYYKTNKRSDMFLFSYNDNKKELAFSYLSLGSLDYIESLETLQKIIEVNLYI